VGLGKKIWNDDSGPDRLGKNSKVMKPKPKMLKMISGGE
jgi:hypothetical protein